MAYIGKVPADVLIDPMVDSAAITDATIVTADIANDAVTSAKLAANSIDSSELIDGSVDNSHLAGSIAINKTNLTGGTGLTLSTDTLNVDAAQTQITSVGTLTSFRSTGIDDNADALSITIDSSERVGIGITAPVSTTHIYENTTATDSSAGLTIEQAGTGDAILQFLETGTQRWVIGLDNSDGDKFKISSDGDLNSNARLTIIPASGNVGIGTASPDSKLHLMVADASATADADFGHLVVENSGHAGINILAGTSSVGAIVFGDSGDSRIGELRYSNNDDAMEFKTNNAVQMYINSSGNVGIGTTSPATKLDITQSSFSASAALRINNPSHNEHWDLAISNNSGTLLELSNYNSGTTMVWNNGGNVGIGQATPQTDNSTARFLHIGDSGDATSGLVLEDNEAQWEIQNNGHLRIYKGSTNVVEFDMSSSRATFAGDIKIADDLYFNSISAWLIASGSGGTLRVQSFDELEVDGVLDINGTGESTFAGMVSIEKNAGYGSTVDLLKLRNSGAGNTRILFNNYANTLCTITGETNDVSSGSYDDGTLQFHTAYNGVLANRLQIENNGTLVGSATNDISDGELKKNIKNITNGIDTIKQLQGRTFEWKVSASMPDGVKYGLIAQELEEVLPHLVYDKTGIRQKADGSWYKSIAMSGVIPVLIEAVKELSAKVEALEST